MTVSHTLQLQGITLGSLTEVAAKLQEAAGTRTLWAFYGEMGAGKTTLIKALCKYLGVQEDVSSPTFSLVNEYQTTAAQKIYHFDFYRIRTLEEVYDIGYEDYFDKGDLCLMEWPDKVAELLENEDIFRITITKSSADTRSIEAR
jgi:tRNA threonylcarbamoyladenosine biosynthesis protein TsaE